MNNKIPFIDLFSGIGGIKIGFEKQNFKSVFSNDFDQKCKITYDMNFYKNGKGQQLYLGDIRKIKSNDIPNFDFLTAGFPCQPFSIAGYKMGFDDKGRGDLFFEIIRILKDRRPVGFMLENVKNLKTHNKGKTLKIVYNELENIGYNVTDGILNTKDYGNISQNRERIYIIGFLDKSKLENFRFPKKTKLKNNINNCFEKNVDDRYYYNGKFLYDKLKDFVTSKNKIYQWRRCYVRENKSSLCPTLTSNMGTGGHNVPIILDDKGIRKLTPRECANFQGFPKNYKLPNISDSHLYKQIGNSVSVPVIARISKSIMGVF